MTDAGRIDAKGADPRGFVPHREPILCLDRVIDAGLEFAEAERVVRDGSDVDDGVLWEEGLVEGLAQTAAVLHAYIKLCDGRQPGQGMLVGVRKFTVHRRARVGERLVFRADLIRRITPLSLVRCEVRVGDEVLATGEMKFFVEEEPPA